MSTIQDPRKTWLATGSLLTVGGECHLWGRDCRLPSSSAVAHLPLCLQHGEGPVCSQPALLWYSFSPLFCECTRGHREVTFMGKFLSFFFFISLVIPRFGLLSHISSLRLFSWHSGPVVTLRTNDAACTSLPSPCLPVADESIWATSPLAVMVRHVFCGLFF